MGVTNTNATDGPFLPNGVATSFPFTFKALDPAEVALFDQAGVEIDVSFSVILSATGDGGSVVFASAPTAGEMPPFLIVSVPNFGIAVSLGSTTAFNPRTLNPAFERLAIQGVHLKEAVNASLRVPPGEAGTLLPPAAQRIGGNKILGPHPVTGAIGVLDGGAFRGDKGDKGDPGDKDGGAIVWLDDFIQTGDSSASAAFSRCHEYLAERIGYGQTAIARVMCASSHYHLGDPVLIDQVALQVVGRGCSIGPNPGTGTWFTVADDSFTPFTISLGSQEARGAGFWNIGVAQLDHPDPAMSGWAPKDYPHIFNVDSLLGEFTLENIYALNINQLIKSDYSGRTVIRNLAGMIFKNAATFDRCYDIPRIENVHLWNYWTGLNPVLQYQQAHLDAFVFGRCDTPFLDNIFVFGSNSMIKTVQTSDGICTKLTAGKLVCDFTRHALLIDSPEFTCEIGSLIHQGEAWPSTGTPMADAETIKVLQPNATMQIAMLDAQRLPKASVSVEATGVNVEIGSAKFDRINMDDDGSGAIKCVAGSHVHVGRYRIINSNGAPLSHPGGALASSGVQQNYAEDAVNQVFAAATAEGEGPKLYPDGPAANIPLQLAGKGTGPVKVESGLKLKPISASELPPIGDLGTQFVISDAASSELGVVVEGGGALEVVVTWLSDGWRVSGGSNRPSGSGIAPGAIMRLAGENADGEGVQQPVEAMIAGSAAHSGLAERVDGLEGVIAGRVIDARFMTYRPWRPIMPHSVDGSYYPDGKTLPAIVNDVILFTGQSDARLNGPWVYKGASTAMTRPTGYAAGSIAHPSLTVSVTDGIKYGGQQWHIVAPYSAEIDADGTIWEQIAAEPWEPNSFLAGPESPSTIPGPPVRRMLVAQDLPYLRARPGALLTRPMNELIQGDIGRLKSYADPTTPDDWRSAFRDAARYHRVVLIDAAEVPLNGSLNFVEMEDTTFIAYGSNGMGGVTLVQNNPAANTIIARANQRWVGSLLRIAYKETPTSAALKAIDIASGADNIHFDLDILLENCPCGVFFEGGNSSVSFQQLELGAGCMGRAVYAGGTTGNLVERVYFEAIYGASTDVADPGLIDINSYVDDFEIGRGQLSGGQRAFYSHDSAGVAGSAPRNIRLRDFKALGTTQSNYYLTAGRDILFDHVAGDTAGLAGITIGNGLESITISSPRFQRAQRDGISINSSTLRRCTISDPMCADNNQANSTYGGIGIETGTHNVSIRGGSCGPSPDGTIVTVGVAAAGAHSYGVDVRGTNHRNIIVDGVDCSNVVQAAGYRDQTTAAGSATTNRLTAFMRMNIPGTAGAPFADGVSGAYLAYGAGWSGSMALATRTEIYEKVEALEADRLTRDAINLTGNLPSSVTLTRASTGRYFNASGVLTTAAIDAARLAYRYNGAAWVTAGLQVEGASTNIITYSSDFTNAYWTKSNCTITLNSGPALDGTTGMALLTTSGAAVLRQTALVTVLNETTYSWSGVFKAGPSNPIPWLLITLGDATNPANGGRLWFNPNTGAIGTVEALGTGWAVGTPEVEQVGAGIWRLGFPINTGGTSAILPRIVPVTANNGASTPVSGSTVYIDHFQCEVGPAMTSIMPTAGATASRSADVASIDWKTTRKSPKGPIDIRYTFDDGTAQTVAATALSSGVSTIPTNLNRRRIKHALNLTLEG